MSTPSLFLFSTQMPIFFIWLVRFSAVFAIKSNLNSPPAEWPSRRHHFTFAVVVFVLCLSQSNGGDHWEGIKVIRQPDIPNPSALPYANATMECIVTDENGGQPWILVVPVIKNRAIQAGGYIQWREEIDVQCYDEKIPSSVIQSQSFKVDSIDIFKGNLSRAKYRYAKQVRLRRDFSPPPKGKFSSLAGLARGPAKGRSGARYLLSPDVFTASDQVILHNAEVAKDFAVWCNQNGRRLTVMIVPQKASLFPEDLINGAEFDPQTDGWPNIATVRFQETLRALNVRSVDLNFRCFENRNVWFSENDSHWSPNGVRLAVSYYLAEIDPEFLGETIDISKTSCTWRGNFQEIPYFRQLRTGLNDSQVTVREISLQRLTVPVEVVGDSHVRWYEEVGLSMRDLIESLTPYSSSWVRDGSGFDDAREAFVKAADRSVGGEVLWIVSERYLNRKWKKLKEK